MSPFSIYQESVGTNDDSGQTVQSKIQEILGSNRVVIFMKGTPDRPQCGFSMRAVELLKKYNSDFCAVDVLKDPAIRQGIKDFSDWPTIPQVYANGEFLGGSDILMEMDERGELQGVLG
jgi:monothiol glutaredoxin